ncbi:MAG TPA: adenylate/guanylate cyclase domain-containing protein, partial [Gemmatimonadaceae bacterium]|nr:adenylate/guanylate cyclase domain-containing protein [Gemmatimonadaceae bacterium]
GAEELSQHISRLFEKLTAQVHFWGGSVVTFIGDAMLCWFGGADNDSPDEASARAAQAAFALQNTIASFKQLRAGNGRSIAFALKVGIASGNVRRFLIGSGSERVYDLLAGKTVDRAVAAASTARPGEVVVTQEIFRRVGLAAATADGESNSEFLPVSAAATSQAPPPAPEAILTSEQIRPWLPAAVYERLTSGQSFLAEFRSAIPLFVHFESVDVDGEEAGPALDAFVRQVAEVVRHYGGELLQVVAGDKGNHLYVTFGVPVAHDDDEERAMAAALDLRDVASRSPGILSTKIGLSRGRTFVGLFGAPSRHSYAALGDTVNLAARLMGHAAAGQILVSDRIKSDAAFTMVPRGSIQVKGRAEPVAIRELVARRDDAPTRRREHAGELVGRARELDALFAALEQPRDASFVAAIDGEAGIGKSRLLGALVDRMQGARVLGGWAESVGHQSAYHAWVGVLRALISATSESPASRREALTARLAELGPDATRRAPLLAPLLRLEIADNELTAQMAGDIRANNTRMLVADLLANAAQGAPLLLTFEDAHWFDSASWALLREVRRRVGNLKIVITARPESEHDAAGAAEYRRFLQEPHTLHVPLGALPAEDSLLLAAHRLGVSTLPPPVARAVRQRAEGNPLYVQELVLAMLDAGHIIVSDGECALASGLNEDALAEYPETVEGIVASRVDRLSPDEQLTVKVASVIGRRFAVDALRDIHPAAPKREALDGWLATLEQRGLTAPDVVEGRPAFTFTHAVLQQVVYDSLLFAHRKGLHRSVAEWIEREEHSDLTPHYPALARHWEVAGDIVRTIDYLERAGEQATTLFANEEAVSFLTKAQQLAKTQPTATDIAPSERLAKWSRLLGKAFLGEGNIDAGYASMRDALRHLGRPEPGRAKMAFGLLGHVVIQTGHRLVGARWLSKVGNRNAAVESAEIYQLLTTPYFARGDWLGGLYANWYTANVAERYAADERSSGLLALALTNLGGAWLNIVPIRRIGDWYLHAARKRALADRDFRALGWNYLVEATVRVMNCYVDEAQAPIDEARRILRELGDGRRWEEVTYFLTTWHFYCGRYDASVAAAREQLMSAQSRDDVESQLLARNQLALVAVARGESSESETHLAEALKLHERGGNLAERVCTLGIRALALARAADTNGANETLRATAPLLDQLGIGNLAIEGFSAMVEAVFVLEDAGASDLELRALARKAWRLLAKTANTLSRVHKSRALVLDGALARKEGRAKRAAKRWPRAIARAERDHVPYEAARARLEWASDLALNDSRRSELLQNALITFEQLGTRHEFERASRLFSS